MAQAGLDGRVKSLEETSQILRSVPDRLGRIEVRMDQVESRLGGVERRLDGVDRRLDGVDRRLDALETQILRTQEDLTLAIHATVDRARTDLRAEVRGMIDDLRAEIRAGEKETRRHMGVLLEHAVAQMHALFDASRQPPH